MIEAMTNMEKIMQIFLQFLSNIYIKKISDSARRLGRRIRKLTHLNYSENGINRIKTVIRKLLENKTIRIDKIKNLKETKIKTAIIEGKIKIRKLWDEFKIKKLEINIRDKIKK